MQEGATRDARSFADLTRAHFGRALSMDNAWDLVGASIEGPSAPMSSGDGAGREVPAVLRSTWIGSVGYERYKLNTDFAQMLVAAGVERLIDVRDLPISRRRGYAKTKLGEALTGAGIEYVHIKALGNPKPIRDLYKSGQTETGRQQYEALLLSERREALDELALMLESKRTALMCVEHDACLCHRTAIVDALRDELGLNLDVVQLG